MSRRADSGSIEVEPTVARKYLRPRRSVAWMAIVLGLILGVGGGLLYTSLNPVAQSEIAPHQLDSAARAEYVAAIALAYAQDGDVTRAFDRLLALRLPGDPIQAVADIACQKASAGGGTRDDITTLRAMMRFYQLQGRTGCADQILPSDSPIATRVVNIELPTATIVVTAPPSKTPTPSIAAETTPQAANPSALAATTAPDYEFVLATINTFCDPALSGIIEVYVYNLDGANGLPGQEVRARWRDGESRFFTGLKPERGAAYTDFTMESSVDYVIDMPERSDPVAQTLSAIPCTTEQGARALRSYRVVFRAA